MELIAIAAGVLALIVACTVLVYQIAQRKKEAHKSQPRYRYGTL